MKKITFILLALLSGTAFGQTASADTSANIIMPVSITNTTNSVLSFGDIVGDAIGGDVTVSQDGVRTAITAGMTVPTVINSPSAALFEVKAADGYTYGLNIVATALSGAGTAMPLTLDHNLALSGNTGTGTQQQLKIGGTLKVGPNQTPGLYEGTIKVDVFYE